MLSKAQIEMYREEGYCTAPDFFTEDEVTAIRAELESLKERNLICNVATDEDGATASKKQVNLQVCPICDKSTFFRALPFADKVRRTIAQLIGDPVVFRLDQIFLKPAGNGAGTSWHQDNFYFQIPDPLMGVGMWTAVHKATIRNGTMNIIPGITPDLPHERDPKSNHHSRCYPDESKAFPIELPAGGVLFFNYNVPHCTRGNTTEADRAGLAMHFYNGKSAPGHEWAKEIRSIIHGDGYTAGVKEWGESQEGAWEREVQRVLAAV